MSLVCSWRSNQARCARPCPAFTLLSVRIGTGPEDLRRTLGPPTTPTIWVQSSTQEGCAGGLTRRRGSHFVAVAQGAQAVERLAWTRVQEDRPCLLSRR